MTGDADRPAAGLRVLLVCEWFVKYTTGLARGLADAGCEVTLLTRDHDLEFGAEPGAMMAFVEETLDGRARHLALGGRVRELSRLSEVGRLRRAVRERPADVIHIQDSLAHDMRLAVAAGLPLRGGYALTIHDPTPHPGDPGPTPRIALVRKALRRRAALLFAHSETLAGELRDVGDVRGAVEVLPLPFVGRVEVAPLPERPSLLFFGRISHYKGLDTLLEAMPAVWERLPEVTLTIAGEGDPPAAEALHDPRVVVRNAHVPEEEVAGLFAACSCVVLPYRQASQSGVGSAARQYGRALVATAVGGLPELVDPSWGLLVPPEDPQALAAAIVEVVGTPGRAAEMGRGAAESAAEGSWENVSRLTLAAYRRHLL